MYWKEVIRQIYNLKLATAPLFTEFKQYHGIGISEELH
jgi:hypothetical protein